MTYKAHIQEETINTFRRSDHYATLHRRVDPDGKIRFYHPLGGQKIKTHHYDLWRVCDNSLSELSALLEVTKENEAISDCTFLLEGIVEKIQCRLQEITNAISQRVGKIELVVANSYWKTFDPYGQILDVKLTPLGRLKESVASTESANSNHLKAL